MWRHFLKIAIIKNAGWIYSEIWENHCGSRRNCFSDLSIYKYIYTFSSSMDSLYRSIWVFIIIKIFKYFSLIVVLFSLLMFCFYFLFLWYIFNMVCPSVRTFIHPSIHWLVDGRFIGMYHMRRLPSVRQMDEWTDGQTKHTPAFVCSYPLYLFS